VNFKYLLLGLIFFISCIGPFKKETNHWEPPVFPSPPAQPRVQFLTSFSNSSQILGKRSGFMGYIFGKAPEYPINKPYGITVHKNKIYICDTMLPGLEIIDLKNRTFKYFTPGGLGKFIKPLNCALDSLDRLYVADAGRKQVVVFDKDLNYIMAVNNGEKYKPTDVEIYNGHVWICDLGGHLIEERNPQTMKVLQKFPTNSKNTKEYLFSPTNIALFKDKIYVTDTGDTRVKVFTLSGDFTGMIGSFGKHAGQFVRPKGIALDKLGNIIVTDAAFENAQIFDNTGRVLMSFGSGNQGKGYMSLPASVIVDYQNLYFFNSYVIDGFDLKYLIFVANQYGPDKISVYGFVEPKKKK